MIRDLLALVSVVSSCGGFLVICSIALWCAVSDLLEYRRERAHR